jgi:hypothetical protein
MYYSIQLINQKSPTQNGRSDSTPKILTNFLTLKKKEIMAHSGAIRKNDGGIGAGKFYNIDGGSSSDGDQDDGYHNYKSSIHNSSRIRSRFQLSPKTSSNMNTTSTADHAFNSGQFFL